MTGISEYAKAMPEDADTRHTEVFATLLNEAPAEPASTWPERFWAAVCRHSITP